MKKEELGNKEFDLNWGIKGLKVSLLSLVLILIFVFIFLLINQNSFSALSKFAFSIPTSKEDYFFIFAGAILFIAVPFVLGIRVGWDLRKKK